MAATEQHKKTLSYKIGDRKVRLSKKQITKSTIDSFALEGIELPKSVVQKMVDEIYQEMLLNLER